MGKKEKQLHRNWKELWEEKETYLTNESENKVVDGDISI
jgi:hypothetical protein